MDDLDHRAYAAAADLVREGADLAVVVVLTREDGKSRLVVGAHAPTDNDGIALVLLRAAEMIEAKTLPVVKVHGA